MIIEHFFYIAFLKIITNLNIITFTFISILWYFILKLSNLLCRGNACNPSHLLHNFNNTRSTRGENDVRIHWRALLYIHIMSRSEPRREGPRVLRAVISARLEKLHRNPRTARGGPLFGEAIPATRNNLAAEAYYYGHSPGQFIPGSFPDLLPSSFCSKNSRLAGLKIGCFESHEISLARTFY